MLLRNIDLKLINTKDSINTNVIRSIMKNTDVVIIQDFSDILLKNNFDCFKQYYFKTIFYLKPFHSKLNVFNYGI